MKLQLARAAQARLKGSLGQPVAVHPLLVYRLQEAKTARLLAVMGGITAEAAEPAAKNREITEVRMEPPAKVGQPANSASQTGWTTPVAVAEQDELQKAVTAVRTAVLEGEKATTGWPPIR